MTTTRPCAKCEESQLEHIVLPAEPPDEPVEVDRCQRCRGVFLDWDEVGELKDLSRLIPSMTGNAAWRRDLEGGTCPACVERPPMLRLPIGAFGVDRCPECLGLWFDGGELGPVLTDQGFEALLRALRKTPA